MTKQERENMIDNITNSATIIEAELGPTVSASVFERFGTSNILELGDGDLSDVFSELYAIEADLRQRYHDTEIEKNCDDGKF